jgi:hypothetical protein
MVCPRRPKTGAGIHRDDYRWKCQPCGVFVAKAAACGLSFAWQNNKARKAKPASPEQLENVAGKVQH